jgi:hypothetical protein
MDAHTTANNNIRLHHTDALKLHVVNHKYAAQIAAHAHPVERHCTHKHVRLHAKIKAEAWRLLTLTMTWTSTTP